MSGFKTFILRGNLIELAVAFIMGTAFATVVTATVNVIMGLISHALGNKHEFDKIGPAWLAIGPWLTAVVGFLLLAAVVYFLIVLPYTRAKERFFPAEAAGPTEVELLTEIRDALKARDAG